MARSDDAGACQAADGESSRNRDDSTDPGVPAEAEQSQHPWRAEQPGSRLALGVWAILALTLLVLFWETSESFVAVWSRSRTFGHGFLVVPICLYLLWTRRADLAATMPRPSPWALVLFAGALLGWLAGDLTETVLVKQLGLVLMVQLSFLCVLGTRLAKVAIFPLLFLFFAVPFGESVIPPLQDLTARFVVSILRATGMPVYLEGVFIQIPSGRFHVAEACAGARYLLTSLALGVLMSGLFYRALWRKVLIIALSIAVPIVANGFRAYGIIMVAHLTDYEVAIGADHILYGMVFLGFVTICLVALGMTFREQGAAGLAGAPDQTGHASPSRFPASVVLVSVAALLLAGTARGYDTYLPDRLAGAKPLDAPRLTVSEPWTETQVSEADWQPIVSGADTRSIQTFSSGGRSVTVSVSLFAYQRSGAEAVTSRNDLAGSDIWSTSSIGQSQVRIDGQAKDVTKITLVAPRRTRVVWYWYWVDGRFTGNPYFAKSLEVKAKLFGGSQRAAVIAVSVEGTSALAPPETTLEEFLDHLSPLGPALEAASGASVPAAGADLTHLDPIASWGTG